MRRVGYDGSNIKPVEPLMSKTYLPYDPDQQLLLPAALQEWLPDDHLAYFISDVVDQLDLFGDHVALRAGKARWAAVPSSDDGQGAALRLLHRSGVIAAHCPAAPRGHCLSGAGGEQHPGLSHHLRLPQGPPGGVDGVIPAGAGVVPAGGAGEAGPCGAGRRQGEGQRIEAQGDEL